MVFSPDNKTVAFADRDGWLVTHAVADGKRTSETYTAGGLLDLAWSTQGLIAASSASHDFFIYRGDNKALVERARHGGAVEGIDLSPDGKSVATVADDGYFELWTLDGVPYLTTKVTEGSIGGVSYSPDGSRVAVTTYVDLFVFDVRTGRRLLLVESLGEDTDTIAWSPDGKRLAVGGDDNEVWLLDANSGKLLHRVKGHTAKPTVFAFTPNGAELISGAYDTTLLAWPTALPEADVEDEPPVKHSDRAAIAKAPAIFPKRPRCAPRKDGDGASLPPCVISRAGSRRFIVDEAVRALAFSREGTLAATSWGAKTTIVDVKTGAHRQVLLGDDDSLEALQFTPDGRHLVAMSNTYGWLWELGHGRVIDRFDHGFASGSALAITSDGARIVTGGTRLVIHDRRRPHESIRRRLEFSPELISVDDENKTAIISDERRRSELVSLADGQMLKSRQDIALPRFVPGGDVVAIGDDDHLLVGPRFDDLTDTGIVVGGSNVESLLVSGDGSVALSFRGGSHADVIDLGKLKQVSTIPVGPFDGAALSHNGRLLATADDHAVRLWNTDSGALLTPSLCHKRGVMQLWFGVNGNLYTSAGTDSEICAWDPRSGKLLDRYDTKHGWLAVSANGRFVVYESKSEIYTLWDLKTDTRHEPVAPPIDCSASAISNDGKSFACSDDTRTQRYDARSRKSVETMNSRSGVLAFGPGGALVASADIGGQIDDLVVTPDGKTILTGGVDESWQIFSAGDHKKIFEPDTRDDVVRVAIHPDGVHFATISGYGVIELWSLKSRSMLHRFRGHRAPAYAVAFSHDGALLAVGGTDGTTLIYETSNFF